MGFQYFKDYMKALGKGHTWDHLPDVARAIPKGLASGGNMMGQTALSIGRSIAGRALPRRVAEPVAGRISSWQDWLTRTHDDAQKFWGDYKYKKDTKDSFLKTFRTAPGQAVHKTVGYLSPAIATAGLGRGVGTMTSNKALSNMAYRMAGNTIGTGGPLGVVAHPIAAGVAGAGKYLGMLGTPGWKGGLLRAGATAGAFFPVVDRLAGLTHVQAGDSPFKAFVKRRAGGMIPAAVMLDPVRVSNQFAKRMPSIYDGLVSGAARGMVEMNAHTASNKGLIADATNRTRANIGSGYDMIANHIGNTAGKVSDAYKRKLYRTVPQILAEGVTDMPWREAIQNADTDPLLTAAGVQQVESRPFVANTARKHLGEVHPVKSAARGLWEAFRASPSVRKSTIGQDVVDFVTDTWNDGVNKAKAALGKRREPLLKDLRPIHNERPVRIEDEPTLQPREIAAMGYDEW